MKISLFYQHVSVLDYAYLDDHRGLVGQSYIVDVEFIGQTDDEGIVYDFSYAKKKVKEIIDRDCDHRLVVPSGLIERMGDVGDMRDMGDMVSLKYRYGHGDEEISYLAPADAICEIPSKQTHRSHLESFLSTLVGRQMPPNIIGVAIALREESLPPEEARFHYTHGLKDHYGNCQRLMHGHCNTVEVEVNGRRRPDLAQKLAETHFFGNIHFCFWKNVANQKEIAQAVQTNSPEGVYGELPPVQIRYQASQGEFSAVLPGRLVYFLQEESTVENLSIHFARLIKKEFSPQAVVKVRAFEGIGKGASATF